MTSSVESARHREGFSLLELMTVVGVIGILAAIAVPSYLGYLQRAKASEAPPLLRSLYQSSAAYYASTRRDREGTARGHCLVDSSGPLPSTVGPRAAVVDFSSDPSFGELGFAASSPIRYSYEIVSEGGCGHAPNQPLYSFRAHGDLDGDGERSLIEMAAGSNPDNVLLRTPGFYRERELE